MTYHTCPNNTPLPLLSSVYGRDGPFIGQVPAEGHRPVIAEIQVQPSSRACFPCCLCRAEQSGCNQKRAESQPTSPCLSLSGLSFSLSPVPLVQDDQYDTQLSFRVSRLLRHRVKLRQSSLENICKARLFCRTQEQVKGPVTWPRGLQELQLPWVFSEGYEGLPVP